MEDVQSTKGEQRKLTLPGALKEGCTERLTCDLGLCEEGS